MVSVTYVSELRLDETVVGRERALSSESWCVPSVCTLELKSEHSAREPSCAPRVPGALLAHGSSLAPSSATLYTLASPSCASDSMAPKSHSRCLLTS